MKRKGGKDKHLRVSCTCYRSRERSQSMFSYGKQVRESDNRKDKRKPREGSRSRKGVKCYYCDKPGYIKKDCRKYERDKKGKDEAKIEENSIVAVVFDGDVVIVCDNGYFDLNIYVRVQ